MAADQRKRRLNPAIGFGYYEQIKAKKKNLGSSQYDLNLNPHVSLKWDDNEKKVVPREEQIGISWRHLNSIAAPPRDRKILADVFIIPKDVFQLKDLTEILSYEVWDSLLTEQERDHLKQFLPEGIEPDQVVQSLLLGENFHFGNPFLQWGTSLCSGNLHPDAIHHYEQSFRASKKGYYSELKKYHDSMIENLQNLKEMCTRSKDPEAEILMMRSRRRAEVNMPSDANEMKTLCHEENVTATSESCSWIGDEKACARGNLNFSSVKGAELQKRYVGKDAGKDKVVKSEVSSDELKSISRANKGERPNRTNINYSDGAKYMSYVKISKKQHELVKSMKLSENGFQSKTLNRVLDNFDNFQVKPYEMFEKEEQDRINEYWSNLAIKDIPSAFTNWRDRQSERSEIVNSLQQELEEKLKLLVEDEQTEYSNEAPQSRQDGGAGDQSDSDNDMVCDPSSAEDLSSRIPSLNVKPEFSHMDLNAENDLVASETSEYHGTSGVGEGSQNVSGYHENHSSMNPVKTEELPCASAADVWTSASMADSYCRPSANVEYASSSELSLRHPQVVEEHSSRLIDLECNMHVEDSTKDLLHQEPAALSFYNSYQNRDGNDLLLHSLIKPENYQQEHARIDFHPTNMMMGSSQFLAGPFREQLQPPPFGLEHRQKGESELFMHQGIQENLFPDNSRYNAPRQEHFPPIGARDWNTARMPAPIPPHLGSGELLNHNWFSSENRTHSGWSTPECNVFSNQGLASGSSGDQSLYSVLSQCSNLRSLTPFDAIGSTNKFIPTTNFGEELGRGTLRINNPLPQATTPLDYMNGHDSAAASAALKSSNMGWMSLTRQTTVHDPMQKPFLRSWNQ